MAPSLYITTMGFKKEGPNVRIYKSANCPKGLLYVSLVDHRTQLLNTCDTEYRSCLE